MSIELAAPKAPKRARGKVRVAALLDAAAALFLDKGYEATTMTEIAARAGASIGSLYQFFPSKEAVADALVARYAERVCLAFAELVPRAPGTTPLQLANLFIDQMSALRQERDVAVALTDVIASIGERKKPLRELLRLEIAAILRAAMPGLRAERARVGAVLVMHTLKLLPRMAAEEAALRRALLPELRNLLTLYLTELAGLTHASQLPTRKHPQRTRR